MKPKSIEIEYEIEQTAALEATSILSDLPNVVARKLTVDEVVAHTDKETHSDVDVDVDIDIDIDVDAIAVVDVDIDIDVDVVVDVTTHTDKD
jgi:hypothetical protein